MTKLSYLIDDLRRSKFLGPSSDFTKAHIIWQSDDTLLMRYYPDHDRACDQCSYVLVRRTGRSYYRVTILRSTIIFPYRFETSFRNFRLAAEFIKNFF